MRTLVQAIDAGPRPAVIIIQADEGPFPEEFSFDEPSRPKKAFEFDWTEVADEQLKEKFSILLAVRFPDLKFSRQIETPINLYPITLNQYFNGNAEMIEEEIYVFPSNKNLYRFEKVTSRLRDPEID